MRYVVVDYARKFSGLDAEKKGLVEKCANTRLAGTGRGEETGKNSLQTMEFRVKNNFGSTILRMAVDDIEVIKVSPGINRACAGSCAIVANIAYYRVLQEKTKTIGKKA